MIVTIYVPGVVRSDADTVRVAEPVPPGCRLTEDELRTAVGWAGESPAVRLEGATFAVRLTLPEKPLTLVNVNVEVPEDPIEMDSEVGLAATPKSTMSTETVTARVRLPFVPVTRMV